MTYVELLRKYAAVDASQFYDEEGNFRPPKSEQDHVQRRLDIAVEMARRQCAKDWDRQPEEIQLNPFVHSSVRPIGEEEKQQFIHPSQHDYSHIVSFKIDPFKDGDLDRLQRKQHGFYVTDVNSERPPQQMKWRGDE